MNRNRNAGRTLELAYRNEDCILKLDFATVNYNKNTLEIKSQFFIDLPVQKHQLSLALNVLNPRKEYR